MKFFKYIGISVLAIGVSLVGLLLWLDRPQRIDFAKLIPIAWETCEGRVEAGTESYESLSAWLQSNTTGWRSYVATPAVGYTYSSDQITIHVYESGVVINYHDEETWSQVQKQADTRGINGNCQVRS